MKIRTIHSFGTSLLVLGLAAGCTVTTTSGDKDGGDHGTGATGGDDSGTGGTGSGGKAGSAGTGGSGNAGGKGAAGGAANGDAGPLDGSASSSGGAAGAGGGAAGAAGDAGPGGGTDGGSDPCGSAETSANDDRDHSTPYVLGTEFHGCLQSDQDVDFYSYTVPAAPAQGGYVVMSLTEVGTNGGLNATTQAVADNGDLINAYGTGGQSVFHWFNAKAGAKFRIKIDYFSSSAKPTPYTLKITYVGVPDANEPNDTRQTATPIMAGKAATGYLFAGYETSTGIPDPAWEDWFKVTLPVGTASVTLSDVPSDISGDITLYDSLGAQVANEYAPTDGASVVMSHAVTAGDYYVKVAPFTRPEVKNSGSTVPVYLSRAYTLKASVP